MYGMRLRELREEKNLTQKQLAEKLQVDFRTVSFWENEKFEPNIDQINRICNYFSVTSDYLLGRHDYF